MCIHLLLPTRVTTNFGMGDGHLGLCGAARKCSFFGCNCRAKASEPSNRDVSGA